MKHGPLRRRTTRVTYWIIPITAVFAVGACTGTSPQPGSTPGGDGSLVAVDNRVRVGENSWIVEPGKADEIVTVGAIESFEVVNDSGSDISVPDVGLNKSTFRIVTNTCSGVLKPGQSCVVKGEWLADGPRDATLDVAVTKLNEPDPATKRISVGLGQSLGAGTPPKKTFSPTPSPTPTASSASPSPTPSSTTVSPTPTQSSVSPTPSQSASTGIPTPTSSTAGTSTPAGAASQSAAATGAADSKPVAPGSAK